MPSKAVPTRRAPRPQHDPRYQRLAGLLLESRKAAGLTQNQLGALVGRTQTYVAKVERCSRRIDPIEMVVWIKACKAEPKNFFAKVLRL
jgi:transcriptional regulator with XRE-family HTH domain